MIKKIALFIFLAIVGAVGTGAWVFRSISPTHPALESANLPPLVPLRTFYANTEARWRYSLSPDGSKLSWLESKWFRPALWVKPLGASEAEIFSTSDEVRWYVWASNSRHLLYQADRDG